MTALAVATAVASVLLMAWPLRPPPRRTARAGAATSATAGTPPRRGRRRRRVAVGSAIVAIALLTFTWPPLAIAGLAAAVAWPRWRRARQRRQRREAIARALPDAIDLFVVAVGAGLTPVLAIGELARLAPAPFDGAFAEVERRTTRGQRLADALEALPERLGEPARALAATIGSAERYGTPLAPALESLAHEARRERRRAAEEAARTLPVKLCFPLVCCTLPAFVLLTIAPLVAGAIRTLRV
jgi:tight adherence protein C